MKSFILPKSINDNINKKMRNFFWGHEDNNRKFHSIKWEKKCKPKNLGGLGIRNPEHQNNALYLSQIWKLKIKPHHPWVQCFFNKYDTNFSKKK